MQQALLSLYFLIHKDLISSGDFAIHRSQTVVFKYFAIKVLDQLCSLVNWSSEVISFATVRGIISFMSFIQSSLSLCSHRLSCFQTVWPCSLVTTPQQAGQLTPEIQPPFHWWDFIFTSTLICKKTCQSPTALQLC